MADNVKISELTELASGSLGDNTIFPVVDGGSTKKAKLSSLQAYLTDDLATDAELSTQISNVNSTINGLDTDDISEGSTNQYFTNARVDARIDDLNVITSSAGVELISADNTGFDTSYVTENASNLYYTDARVKTKLNTEGVYSGSSDFNTAVSTSAAAAGFGTGGGGGGTDNWNNLTNVPDGLVSSSTQITDVIDNDYISASAASSGFGAGGGGGSSDYVSNVSFADTTLTFTGVGSAFSSTIDLSSGDLATQNDINGFLSIGTYTTDSASFASRIDSSGGGGASIPDGTVSSSAQTIANLPDGVVSSSIQIDGSQIDLSSLTTDDISEGVTNKYYANSLVLPYLNQLGVVSGSASSGDWNTLANIPANIVSSSAQVELLGFVTNGTFGSGTASLQQQINDISSSAGSVSLNDVNTFNAQQIFGSGIVITGSINMTGGDVTAFGGVFSGSGANLFGIPGTAIVGGIALSGSTIEDGDVSVVASAASGVTINSTTSGVNVNGDIFIASGSLISGSGAGLTGIPGSAIEGGVDGQKIYSSSFSASITDAGEFLVNTNAIFESDVYSSGSVTAQSISVGTSGTPTIFSSTNLNLSASNAVVVTDSPIRLNPFAAADTASFTLSEGDIVYSSDDSDFFGYRIVNSTGSWYSLTAGEVSSIEWSAINGAPEGLVSSSEQIGTLAGGIFSSSAQFLPSGAADGAIYYEDTLNNMSASSDFTYTAGTRTLNVNKLIANEIVANTSLTEPGSSTGSFGRVETDRLNINGAIEFPSSDGSANEMIITDGGGNLSFSSITSLIDTQTITTTGTITMGTGSVNTDLTVDGTLNIGSPVHSTINNQSSTIDVDSLSLLSSGSMLLSSSVNVTIEDVLVLPERTTNPSNPPSGSLIVSSSAGQLRPYFWDGSTWQGISFTS